MVKIVPCHASSSGYHSRSKRSLVLRGQQDNNDTDTDFESHTLVNIPPILIGCMSFPSQAKTLQAQAVREIPWPIYWVESMLLD
jgi:hypothetical protein